MNLRGFFIFWGNIGGNAAVPGTSLKVICFPVLCFRDFFNFWGRYRGRIESI